MIRLSSALLIIALVCGLILALIYKKTAPIIEKQQQLILEMSLKDVLLAQTYTKKELSGLTYFETRDEEGELAGWCLPSSSPGYGGPIQILIGIGRDKKISGIKILDHKETPGLGSKINEIGYKETEAGFLRQFKNKAVKDLVLVKGKTEENIEAITGATISSKAIVEGAHRVMEEFFKVKDPE
ncbi:MAG: FMN-binding protein [Candidatus Omnitrophota bacterium]